MTEQTLFGVYGASGAGRGVLPVARDMLNDQINDAKARLVFIDDRPLATTVNDTPVLTYPQFLDSPETKKSVCIAIADSNVRQTLADRCLQDKLDFFPVKASNVVIMDAVDIGEGAILSPFVTLTSNIKIGQHFQANLYSYVEHDCVIGDFVTFAPGVRCNGNIVIEDHAYLGSGAVIRSGLPGQPLVIGKGAVVGMGAVVTKNIPAGVTVIGCPAKPMTPSREG